MLGDGIRLDVWVAIEMVWGDVEHHSNIGAETIGSLELEARQLDDGDVCRLAAQDPAGDRITEVAPDKRPRPGSPGKSAEQSRRRALAIGAGDGRHPGRQRRHELELAADRHIAGDAGSNRGLRRIRSGRESEKLDISERRRAHCTELELDAGGSEIVDRQIGALVDPDHLGAAAREQKRHGPASDAETEHTDGSAGG